MVTNNIIFILTGFYIKTKKKQKNTSKISNQIKKKKKKTMIDSPPTFPETHVPQKPRARSELSRPSGKGPFRIPSDSEIFAIRAMSRSDRLNDQRTLNSTKVHLRGLTNARGNFRSMTRVSAPQGSAEERTLAQLILSPDLSEGKSGLRQFIDEKREIFLTQLEIETKREELQRLEKLEREEEEALRKREAEINLFRDQFRSFLENDNQLTADARRASEMKAKERLDVAIKIKQISSEISALRNEIAHHEEKYNECERYREFLEGLTPPDWRKEHPLPELYFKDPHQLIDIIHHLESQNMFLIQHCQDAEEVVERYKMRFADMLEERDKRLEEMGSKKEVWDKKLDALLQQNEQNRYDGEFHHINELPQSEYSQLLKSINEFHQKLGFDSLSLTGDSQSMLKHIEDKMEGLVQSLANMDQKIVQQLLQEKQKRRREQERQEKAAEKQREQDEKTMRALQLATMPIKKKTGRPVIPLMMPFKTESREKREEKMRLEQAQREADQNLLFGPVWD